jgi:pantoate--beta-alanine ligase
MKVLSTIAEMRALRSLTAGPAGFVPTMGYLHEGHLSLIRQARGESQIVIVSIFINPAQFGPGEDYSVYPRDPDRDLDLLKKEGVDIVFMPSVEEMYPPGFNSWVQVEEITQRLEGSVRAGHFKGVTTVVAKLFNIVEPARAYFGQKDAQQALVIRKMVADLDMNLEVVVSPTVRENDGLAMSSRNSYLGPSERRAALILYKSLSLAREAYARGERNAEEIRKGMVSLINEEPLAQIDYVSVADKDTLEELSKVDRPALVSLAVRIGKTRLIDNILVP